ncbi:hypothetical protein D3C81_2170050 [compost metagenome]
MKRGSTLFLKVAFIFIGTPVLALYIFLVPEIANFAAVLQKLLKEAIDIKSENDLTV